MSSVRAGSPSTASHPAASRRLASSTSIRTVRRRKHLQDIPLRRWGDPREFGDVVCFVASDRARYVTGQTIVVDGGLQRGALLVGGVVAAKVVGVLDRARRPCRSRPLRDPVERLPAASRCCAPGRTPRDGAGRPRPAQVREASTSSTSSSGRRASSSRSFPRSTATRRSYPRTRSCRPASATRRRGKPTCAR